MSWFPVPWLIIGIFGYLIGVPFFEVAAGIGLGIWLFVEAFKFLAPGHRRLSDKAPGNPK
jgi:divalent metal cation (Fe/Co/Zn/Cd) transporter